MNRLVSTLAVAGAVGATALVAVPAQAATTVGANAITTCTTVNGTTDSGTGQITICPQSDGSYHLTGWLDNPSNALPWNPNGGCNPGWWLVEGTGGEFGPIMVGTSATHITFDKTITPAAPITGLQLGTFCF